MKRILNGMSIAITLLWMLGVVVVGVKQYVAHRGLLDQLLETATFALVPAAALWGFLYTGFWVTRGSAGQTDIFGISVLTGIGVFFFAFGYSQYAGGLDSLEAIGLSLSMAFGLGCLVAAFLSYRHRDKQ